MLQSTKSARTGSQPLGQRETPGGEAQGRFEAAEARVRPERFDHQCAASGPPRASQEYDGARIDEQHGTACSMLGKWRNALQPGGWVQPIQRSVARLPEAAPRIGIVLHQSSACPAVLIRRERVLEWSHVRCRVAVRSPRAGWACSRVCRSYVVLLAQLLLERRRHNLSARGRVRLEVGGTRLAGGRVKG